MVGKISIHQDDIVASACCKTFNIGASKAKLAGSSVQLDFVTVNFLELLDDVLGTVW